jgi:hypothetical protein
MHQQFYLSPIKTTLYSLKTSIKLLTKHFLFPKRRKQSRLAGTHSLIVADLIVLSGQVLTILQELSLDVGD